MSIQLFTCDIKLIQILMSVWQVYTIAVLMHFVITPTDPSIAHANRDIQEMDKTAQVIFLLVFGLLAWHQNFLVVCLLAFFFFTPLTTYFTIF